MTMEQMMIMQTQLMQSMAQVFMAVQQSQNQNQNQKPHQNHNHNANPPPAPPRDKRGEFMKGRPLVFAFSTEPLHADDWLKAIEKQLDIAQCNDWEKVLYGQDNCRVHD